MKHNTIEVLDILCQHGRQEILKTHQLDSCIYCSRIALDVLEYVGIMARPIVCTLSVRNKIMVDQLLALKSRGEVSAEDIEKIQRDDKAWSVGVGFGGDQRSKTTWPGHLVVLVDGTFILDLSLDQASRPEHDIQVPPTFITLDPQAYADFVGYRPVQFFGTSGTMIEYHRKDDNGYMASRDWTDCSRRTSLVRQLVKIIGR